MISFSDPHQTLVGLHDMLTGWRSIRERRRMRYSPPTAAATPTPPVLMHAAPVGAPPGPGPEAPERATVIAYRKLGDRIVPIFGDPAESADAAHTSANGAPNPSEARAAEAPAAPPQAAPDSTSESSASKRGPQTPPPPDFTPQAVEASSPRRGPTAPPTLDLPPPTPPSLVRADEQAVTLERVLAEHRALLARQTEAQQARHAAMMEAILAEHRRAQAQADDAHRQQLGELLAKHREEVRTMTQTSGEHGQALVDLRELLAEQASAAQAEHARIGEKIESIVDIVGMVGETVHHIAAVAFQPKAPLFGALPTRPVDMTTKSDPDRSMQAPPKPAVNGAARVLPVRPPVAAVATVQPPVEQGAPPTVAPHVAAPQPTATGASPVVEQASPPAPDVTATRPRLAAVSARGERDPAPTPPIHQVPPCGPPAATERVATPSRSPSFTPAAAAILTLTSPPTATPTPRQLRAEAAARERSRLDDAVSDLTLDDTTDSDGPDATKVPNV